MGICHKHIAVVVALLVFVYVATGRPNNKGDGKGKGKGRRSVAEDDVETLRALEGAFSDAGLDDQTASLVLDEAGREKRDADPAALLAEEGAVDGDAIFVDSDDQTQEGQLTKKPCRGRGDGGSNSTDTEEVSQRQRSGKKRGGKGKGNRGSTTAAPELDALASLWVGGQQMNEEEW